MENSHDILGGASAVSASRKSLTPAPLSASAVSARRKQGGLPSAASPSSRSLRVNGVMLARARLPAA